MGRVCTHASEVPTSYRKTASAFVPSSSDTNGAAISRLHQGHTTGSGPDPTHRPRSPPRPFLHRVRLRLGWYLQRTQSHPPSLVPAGAACSGAPHAVPNTRVPAPPCPAPPLPLRLAQPPLCALLTRACGPAQPPLCALLTRACGPAQPPLHPLLTEACGPAQPPLCALLTEACGPAQPPLRALLTGACGPRRSCSSSRGRPCSWCPRPHAP